MGTNNLSVIEELINEFYAPNTTNNRKHDIETQLETFKQDNSSWKHCLCNLTHNNHIYVWMYGINIIEDVITKRWFTLENNDRLIIKEFLWKNIKSKSNCTTQRYQTNKLAKLLTDIIKREFPHGWQEYFQKIMNMVKSSHCHLGIVLFRVTCEEIITRNDINSSRKQQLITSLNGNLNDVFVIVTQLLQSIMNKWSIANTPPSSPKEHVLNESILRNIMSADECSVRELCFELLCTVQHLFSWVELSGYVSSELLNILFALADVTLQHSETISIVALSAITEILYRKCAFAGLSTLLCGQIMRLICRLNYTNNQTNDHIGLTDSYLEKTTELIKTFVIQHYSRLLSETTFDSLQFMSLLFHYTFVVNKQSVDCYMGCLEVWCILLDFNINVKDDSFKNAILSIAASCFNNITFSSNEKFLSTIDKETLDDDFQSDWQHYLKQSFELISKITEFYAYQILSMAVEPWKNLLNIYAQINNAISADKQLNIQETEVKNVLNILQDLSTLSQCISRLASIVIESSDDSNIQQLVHLVITKAVEASQYSNKHELYNMKCSSMEIHLSLQHVQGHLLLLLSSYTSWLAQTQISALQVSGELVQCAIQPILNKCDTQNMIEQKVSKDIFLYQACATLLLNISKTIRPQNLINTEFLPQLFNKELDEKIIISLHQCIINNLILPWLGVTDQNWSTRSSQLNHYTTNISVDFLRIPYDNIILKHDVYDKASLILRVQEGVLKNYEDCYSSAKNMLKCAYEPLMEHALKYINQQGLSGPLGEAIMSFFLTALMVLQHQLGAQFTELAVTGFMNAVKREQLSKIQLYTVDKLLQILKLVVLLPGHAFKGFLPNIINLAINNILPMLSSSNLDEAHDANLSLLSLFDAILQHRWQYFYKSQILMGNSPVQAEGMEELNNINQLQAILFSYGQCLLNGDLTVFGACLQSLECLNDKWMIYHKPFFSGALLPHFLSALLQSLLNEQYSILFDNIIIAIYKMAVVDLRAFCNVALAVLINCKYSLSEQQATTLLLQFQETLDEPTFTQNLAKLIKDLKCPQF